MLKIINIKNFLLINLLISYGLSATNHDQFCCFSDVKSKIVTIGSKNDLFFKDQDNNILSFRAHKFMILHQSGEIRLMAKPQYALIGWNSSEHSPEKLEVVKLEAYLARILLENDAWFVVLKDGQLKVPFEFNHEYALSSNDKIVKEKKKRIKESDLYLKWFLPLPNQFVGIAHYYKEQNMKRKALSFAAPAVESNN